MAKKEVNKDMLPGETTVMYEARIAREKEEQEWEELAIKDQEVRSSLAPIVQKLNKIEEKLESQEEIKSSIQKLNESQSQLQKDLTSTIKPDERKALEGLYKVLFPKSYELRKNKN